MMSANLQKMLHYEPCLFSYCIFEHIPGEGPPKLPLPIMHPSLKKQIIEILLMQRIFQLCPAVQALIFTPQREHMASGAKGTHREWGKGLLPGGHPGCQSLKNLRQPRSEE